MYRDVGYYWLRLLIYGGLAISVGTIFYNIGSSNGSIQVIEYGLICSKFKSFTSYLKLKPILKPNLDGFRKEVHCSCL